MNNIAVVGLGYVGLPLSLQFARTGCSVLGLDIDPAKIEAIQAGRSYIKHIDSGAIADARSAGKFEASTDFARVRQAEAVILCVPTPLNAYREPDLSYVLNTGRQIAPHLAKGALVVLESTTYPGTTSEVLVPKLTENGLRLGADVFVAFSPERVDPGNPVYKTKNTPKVIGGCTPRNGSPFDANEVREITQHVVADLRRRGLL